MSDTGLRTPVLRVLVHGHAWLALGAAAQTWFMQDLMDRQGWQAPVVAALVTFLGYTFMRLARADHPQLGRSPHLVWAHTNARALLLTAAVAAIAAMALAWTHAAALWAMFWPVGAAVLLYAVPMRWAGGRTLGLRRVPLLKALLIAGSWAWTTVALPGIFDLREVGSAGLGWLFAMQLCFFLAIALVFDLRDRDQDRGVVVTLPHVLGERSTRIGTVLLMLYPASVFALLASIGRSMSALEGAPAWPMHQVFAALGYLVAAVVIASSSPRRGPLYFGLLVDGLLVLVPLLYAVGRLL